MWKIAALTDGAWRQVEPVSLENIVPAYANISQAARDMPNAQKLVTYLDLENSLTLGGNAAFGPHDAIELWSAKAQADAFEYDWNGVGKILAVEEGLAYWEPSAMEDDKPGTLARSHGRFDSDTGR